ncbi:hypothetical protein T05_11195 [Trichinella murrelli]|uniref:Uncharacterized protein n=1 Tax=Trichinella murrelli TaxID=144512 RepID=A0A0V0T9U2_9BILA|nr:hypothetical protein T05_11195 [Trichinella murrelli]
MIHPERVRFDSFCSPFGSTYSTAFALLKTCVGINACLTWSALFCSLCKHVAPCKQNPKNRTEGYQSVSFLCHVFHARVRVGSKSKSVSQILRIPRSSWEGFMSPATTGVVSALRRSSSDSP